jgi:TatD family-associated radical SAM protein
VIRLENEAERIPTISDIHEAIKAQLEQREYDEIVIAGEGEPTLRWDALLSISSAFSNQQHTIRVTTNGLLQTADEKASALKQHGVNVVSVALMTGDSAQYTMLMDPRTEELTRAPHDVVCDFIHAAVTQDLVVEITAVDRSEVDKQQTEALALFLGVSTKVRWRTFFP